MLALTIRQPWAHLIIHGAPALNGSTPARKDIENRSWPTSVRGRFAILAGLSQADLREGLGFLMRSGIAERLPARMSFGCIIGTVDLVDCVQRWNSPWFTGPFGLILRNPQPITPVSAWGHLKVWEWSDDTAA